jgi:hypothetical protein
LNKATNTQALETNSKAIFLDEKAQASHLNDETANFNDARLANVESFQRITERMDTCF